MKFNLAINPRWTIAPTLALIAMPALGQSYECRVSHVLSADTVRVTVVTRCQERTCPELSESLRICLSEVDTPEQGQPHYDQAKHALLARVQDQVVAVMPEEINDQGTRIGHLYLEEEWLNGWLVSEGHAWVQASAKTVALSELQAEARDRKRGLWGVRRRYSLGHGVKATDRRQAKRLRQ